MSTLNEAISKFRPIVTESGLTDKDILIRAACLTAEEAIGQPKRQDYPIIKGKERMVEAEFLGAKGQAFTDTPVSFEGKLSEIIEMPLDTNGNRALFIATLNAVLAHVGLVSGTVHCKDEEPEHCADEMSRFFKRTHGPDVSIGLIGFNPAIAERLVDTFGASHVNIADLFDGNIGEKRFGVDIFDGDTQTDALVRESDVLLITGTTLGNGTFDRIRVLADHYERPYYIFGVTGAGVAALTGIPRLCFCGHSG